MVADEGGYGHDASATALSLREQEVLTLASRGMSNREIAGALGVTIRTVEMHTLNAYRKLGVRSRAEALRRATELQLLAKPEQP